MALLEVNELNFSYPGAAPSLRDLSFSVERGDFAVLCGATGSGKSTLLRMLKPELFPRGEKTGEVLFDGAPLASLAPAASAVRIGYVMQRPEQQIVTDRVWHELAFGLENLGLPTDVIRRRVAEMAEYFGMEEWFESACDSLSGGQKQLLNLASVMAMQPDVLLLDEPTAQLDPIAAASFIDTLARLNRELSLTVIIAEHRLEDVIPHATRLIALNGDGTLLACGGRETVLPVLAEDASLGEGMPSAFRLYSRLKNEAPSPAVPVSVREGRTWLLSSFKNEIRSLPEPETLGDDRPAALKLSGLRFRYDRTSRDVLCGVDLTVREGESFCLVGGNGSGKSTLLAAIAGLRPIREGTVSLFGRRVKTAADRRGITALLPQDVQTVFLHETVREELADAGVDPASLPFDLTPVLDRHPYDLSGGQQQMAALAKVLASSPRLLMLDEPTKGLDARSRADLVGVIGRLKENGVTVLTVTHDAEFAARCADRCALFFRGTVLSVAPPRAFFSENRFYTTAISRMTRGFYENAVTVSDAETLCRQNGVCPEANA